MSKKKHKNNTTRKNMSAKEIRAMLLSGSTPIIEDVLKLATGDKNKSEPSSPNANVNEPVRKIVMDAIIPMLQSAGDVLKLRASSTADVVKMIARGKVSIAEAKELMLIMQADFEVTQLPDLVEKFEALQK